MLMKKNTAKLAFLNLSSVLLLLVLFFTGCVNFGGSKNDDIEILQEEKQLPRQNPQLQQGQEI